MSDYHGIPFNGGMDSPTGTGAQHIVETCQAIVDWAVDMSEPETLKHSDGTIRLSWLSQYLLDATETVSLQWENRTLNNAGGDATLSWDTKETFDDDGLASIRWADRTLLDDSGNEVVRWEATLLAGTEGNTSVQWTARTLFSASNNLMFSWASGIGFFNASPQSQQTGGAATAGVAYTSTEQGMINRMYAALRAYGLLT